MMMARDTPRPDPTRWWDQAACKTRPDLDWFPGRGERMNEQRQVCAGCPVRRQCLDEALSMPFGEDLGIWGGLSIRERRQLRKGGGR